MNTIVHFVLLLLGSSGFISPRSLSRCSPAQIAQIDAERQSMFADMLALNRVSNNQTKRAGSALSIRTKRINKQNHWLD